MRIIIIGAGKVGYNLALNLSAEDHDIVIIDDNQNALDRAEENLDVLCIKGKGVSTRVLMDAGIHITDLLIAVTNSDEVNMVCCLTGKNLGAKRTIARIRDPEYARELTVLKEEVGLDMVINPEYAAAEDTARNLAFPAAVDVEGFAKGRVKMIEINVAEDMPIAGKKLKDISSKMNYFVLVGAVVRGGEVLVPGGGFQVEAGDDIYILGNSTGIMNFFKGWDRYSCKLKNVMLVGGGRIAYYLTELLNNMGARVKIIEVDKARCLELAETLPQALIINGDGTDEELLLSENLGEMDVFFALTGMDEENLVSAFMAKENGAKRVVSKISRLNYKVMINKLGIDNIICPKAVTTDEILKYVRGDSIESLYRIVEGQVEILEFIAQKHCKILNIPLKKLNLHKNTLIATIVRKNEVVIPRGNDVIRKGDRVIVIVKAIKINTLDDLLIDSKGGIANELQNGIKKFGDLIDM